MTQKTEKMEKKERQNLSRELSIARQSAIKIGLEFLKCHDVCPTLQELLRLTDVIAEDCLLTPDAEYKKTVKKIDQWIVSKKK